MIIGSRCLSELVLAGCQEYALSPVCRKQVWSGWLVIPCYGQLVNSIMLAR